ncbi:MAG: proline dehydrogenase family protein [Planctomycetota bacterium]
MAPLQEQPVEELTRKLGHEMFERMRGNRPHFHQFAWWQERMLRVCMQDEWFKVQAFRFIDVLPTMQSDIDVARHLREYFVLPEHMGRPHAGQRLHHVGQRLHAATANGGHRAAGAGSGAAGEPWESGSVARKSAAGPWSAAAGHVHGAMHAAAAGPVHGGDGHGAAHRTDRDAEARAALRELEPRPAGRNLVRWVSRMMNFHRLDSLTARLMATIARRSSNIMAGSFIAGSNLAEAERSIVRLRNKKLAFTIDLLGEAALSTTEGEAYQQIYLDLLTQLPKHAAGWSPVPLVDEGDGQPIPRVNVSVKLTSLYPGFDPIAPEACKARAKEILRPLFRKAMEGGAALCVDMEHFAIKDLTLELFEELMLKPEFRDYPHFGIVLQAYLKESDRDGQRMIDFAKHRGAPFWIRLVKGAYWDSETVWAAQRHWPVPVWEQKWQSDACYERMTRQLLAEYQHVRLAFASHNVRSLCHAMAVRQLLGVPGWAFELQALYGMGDPIKAAEVEMGQRCRIYTPYGNMLAGMAYLIRRLLENTANESFLRQSGSDDADEEQLLENPEATGRRVRPRPKPAVIRYEFEEPIMEPFENVANTDFALAAGRQKMQASLAQVRAEFGREHPLIIAGRPVTTGQWFETRNPGRPAEVVARMAQADERTVNQAVEAAAAAFPAWRATSPFDRAQLIRSVAARLEARRFEFAALMAYEVAKTWREADADVSEAIDYCNYYAQETERWAEHPRRRDIEGETNEYFYMPRGVAVVISPWNFPLCLLTNMAAAALVTGNTIVIKPASPAAAIAARLMDVFRETGLPPGVANYLPGPGNVVGEALVKHPRVDIIAFTGSRAVGERINKLAADFPAARPALKRVVADMGAKNAIIVDANADLDEAIKGVMASAFGYAGQKCSACSRVIVLDGAHDRFLERLAEAARSKGLGPAEEPTTSIPPLVNKQAFEDLRRYIELGKREAKCVLAVDACKLVEETGGFYVGPHIFDDVPPESRIAREEIFGPVVAILRARDFDEAVRLFNGTDYALTGGVFSRSPANLEQARAECDCGNLYINRPITGSRVDLQPYGGFKMSGVGAKSGGPDYLLQYCQARTVTENTLRRGFAPSEEVAEALG